METRFLIRVSQRMRFSPAICHFHTQPSLRDNKSRDQQANPIGDYYASLLETSSSTIANKLPSTATPSSTPPVTTPEESAPNAPEAAILFQSRLSSPLERRSEIQKKSVLVAGVWVPPKPEEPDNCCMSGCVNCVWDRYGEEVEEWAAAKKEADVALRKGKEKGLGKGRKSGSEAGLMLGGEKGDQHTIVSMDDDGGGSETNWGTGLETEFTNDDLFRDVPVGIREFMKQEKRLKEKHAREGTKG